MLPPSNPFSVRYQVRHLVLLLVVWKKIYETSACVLYLEKFPSYTPRVQDENLLQFIAFCLNDTATLVFRNNPPRCTLDGRLLNNECSIKTV